MRKDFPECTWEGNLDKRVLTKGKGAIKKEVEYKVPFMKEARGCIPAIDHSVPPAVPLENYLFYLDYLKKFL